MMKKRARPSAKKDPRPWLVEARKKLGLSQIELAKRVGYSQNELSKIETGERLRIDREIAGALANELQMTRERVMFGGSPARTVRIRGDILGDEMVSPRSSEELLDIDWLAEKELEGYRIAVDTLEPRFYKNDLLLCRSKNTALEECHDRECVVEFDDKLYVKHVEKGASVRIVTLRSYRASNHTIVDITPKWVTPVIALIPGRIVRSDASQSS